MLNLFYIGVSLYISLIAALIVGSLASLFDNEFGLITGGVIFSCQFIELIRARQGKW
jgi:hypothetical protein